ncbi:hypothetical protein NKY39_18150 [Sinorhizobium meliloti]|uniref:hypothetical protein n=1 Tax=Rhizobium meliloti TaxID=382 RepID=UPI003D64A10F
MAGLSSSDAQWAYFDVAACLEHVPFLFGDDGAPLWFESGELFERLTLFDLLQAIVLIGGIPAGMPRRSYTRLRGRDPSVVFERGWIQLASHYAIGVKSCELDAAGGEWVPFEAPEMWAEWRAQAHETVRCFDHRGKIVRRSGFPLITAGARDMGITAVNFRVRTAREALKLRATLEDLALRPRNRFGVRVDSHLIGSAEIRVG